MPRDGFGARWCKLWSGTWEGAIVSFAPRSVREPAIRTCPWIRFYDADRHLVLLPEEAERAKAEIAKVFLNLHQAAAPALLFLCQKIDQTEARTLHLRLGFLPPGQSGHS